MAKKKTLAEKTADYNDFVQKVGITQLYPVVSGFKKHAVADETLKAAQDFHISVIVQGLVAKPETVQSETVAEPETIVKPEIVQDAFTLSADDDDDFILPADDEDEESEEISATAKLIETVVRAADLDGQEWYRTGNWIMLYKDRFADDAKGNREVSYTILDAGADESKSVPEMDLNNSGKEVKLRKKDGSVKWSAWHKTRKFTQNLADIFMAVEVSGWGLVFPEGNLVTRPEVLDLKKKQGAGEQPIDTFCRSIDMCCNKIEGCAAEDKEILLAFVEKLIDAKTSWIANL